MADSIRRMDYFYAMVNDKPGQAAKIVEALAADGVGMLAFSGFPQGKKKSQIVFVPEDAKAFKKLAKKTGLRISKTRAGFLIQGEDRTGRELTARWREKHPGQELNYDTGGMLNNLVFKYPGWRAREGFSQPALAVPGEWDDTR